MLYLIGLGLNEKGITLEGIEALKKCVRVYLEGYTVDFPYSVEKLEEIIGKKIKKLGRKEVESDFLVNEAKKEDTALLVYGCPLFATTHETLLLDAKKDKVDAKVISVSGNNISLSIKALEVEEQKDAIATYGSTDSGASLGDILGAALNSSNAAKEKKKKAE